MNINDFIETKPAVMLGKPVIKNTRIPVELIVRKLGEGATVGDLLDGCWMDTPTCPKKLFTPL